jgi:hypothetical protein
MNPIFGSVTIRSRRLASRPLCPLGGVLAVNLSSAKLTAVGWAIDGFLSS